MGTLRSARLSKRLNAIILGSEELTNRNSSLFLEAIYTAHDVAACINKLIISDKGLACLQNSFRFDLTLTFLNGPATAFLRRILSENLPNISNGTFLQPVLTSIVDPPIFWDKYTQAFRDGQLLEDAQLSFAGLLQQLILLPQATPYRQLARDPAILDKLLSSSRREIRAIAEKIKHLLKMFNVDGFALLEHGPGGRHNNDFVDFREIAILPTPDELNSTEQPFLRGSAELDNPDTEPNRLAVHLDNQFRLLREDMLYEMREELQVALGAKKGKHRGLVIDHLTLDGIYFQQPDGKFCRWGIVLQCSSDLWQFKKIKPKERKTFVEEHRSFFRHQSIACLIFEGEIAAFASVNRDEKLLAQNPPKIVLQIEGEKSIANTLLKLRLARQIKILQIDTAVFSYEPILTALKMMKGLNLEHEILFWKEGSIMEPPASVPSDIVQAVKENPSQNFQSLLNTSRPVLLDDVQAGSLISGLTQRVSLIQGPPGTGKSYIGALLAKILHDVEHKTILVVCFTNHALDQFLEDLLDIGIPEGSIVRLGGKPSSRTAHLALQRQNRTFKLTGNDWTQIDDLKKMSSDAANKFQAAFRNYMSFSPTDEQLMGHLEFDHAEYFEAFQVVKSADGEKRVGKKGREASPYYLIKQWREGRDAGIFCDAPHVERAAEIWNMSREARTKKLRQWSQEMLKVFIDLFCDITGRYDDFQERMAFKFNERDFHVLRGKRIIGCTTTGAAKYRDHIKEARPDVLLVEEAGEILESHILTALGEDTSQLILIGDHMQLRPKVNNYALTVEKDEGYDLNRSLFERLILKGYPHKTLREQHRMRPEISDLIRKLTYPDLLDAPGTRNRPNLRGVRDNIVFIHHENPEHEYSQIEECRDNNAKSSKQNLFEVKMVLKIVRYLGQQGYGTDKLVILTPYLGQLRQLQEALKKDKDPVLNDLDSYDLIRAGLVSEAAANIKKEKIRLATIDNYQGEESDIVIASLTRSNPGHDIGFMSSQERLTVLLSRARNALIMIGNSHTFTGSRKGGKIWTKLFEMLKHDGHVYDGLPVHCERHPSRTGLLKCADDFDKESPDGGCLEPCAVMLSCGLHPCPSKCHQLVDHSKMPCEHVMYSKCPQGHSQRWLCHKNKPPATCTECERKKRAAEKKQQEEFELQKKREEEARHHAEAVAELEDKIRQEREKLADAQLSTERRQAIRQMEEDLKQMASLAGAAISASHPKSISSPSSTTATLPSDAPEDVQPKNTDPSTVKEPVTVNKVTQTPLKSAARERWKTEKRVNGEYNDAIDSIMEMTGLEDVKKHVLDIKTKVDTSKRQGASLKAERFNVSMLGNPGTGKTTVARHYGKFLASVQVIPGNTFIETTGSRLANDGIAGIKKQLEDVINAGGGTIFVDEAYQLTGASSFQGAQVLDFLLAEMENNVGKIVFIFAGYNKEMEKFFEHNPGLKSRVPYTLQFKDYEDDELLDMLENIIAKTFNGKMKVEDGIRGLYGRIAIRRLGQGRGRNGFGNARALANMFAKIRERQAARLSEERHQGKKPDDFLFVKEDLIGPDPSKVMVESKAWKKLRSMIGLGAVKSAVAQLFQMADTNYQRELLEKKPNLISLNRVFLGSPGTGKTTVAKYYGQILADLGLISNGYEVVVKNPADFIGGYLGQSEAQTKAILANAVGKVLIIDEAYMLYSGSGSNNAQDSFKTAVIDTIVAEVQSVPGDDRCVLLLGYKEQIEEMFQNVNPGLARRFAIENAFYFHDYTDSELLQALEWKMNDQDLRATDAAKAVAIDVLSRSRVRPNFGNIGEVENLLGKAKLQYQSRQASLPREKRSPDAPFEPQDFDPDFDRDRHAATNLATLFQDVVGCEDIVEELGEWQHMARSMKAHGRDPREQIPTNFVFKGPPGTGKTTTARKMGQVYYDMGFLASTEVIECSASDLVGEYIGHTGPKTRKLFEKALGRVLFIDEAYRLGTGQFAKEAIDELVGILTQESFRGKLIVILAGYDQDMNGLMNVNTGLSSRFPKEIKFRNLSPPQCLEILKKQLEKQSIYVDALEDVSSVEHKRMITILEELSNIPSWGNARDIGEIAKIMISKVFTTVSPATNDTKNTKNYLTLAGSEAVRCVESFLAARRERTSNLPTLPYTAPEIPPAQVHQMPPPPSIRTSQEVNKLSTKPEIKPEIPQSLSGLDCRDDGVTDAVWQQLQVDKLAAEEAARRSREAMESLERSVQAATEQAARALAQKFAAEQAGLMQEREKARLEEIAQKQKRAEAAAALEEEERRKKEEARVQTKLRQMGVCVQGFRWIKQASGYRCAGGFHFIDNASLGVEQ